MVLNHTGAEDTDAFELAHANRGCGRSWTVAPPAPSIAGLRLRGVRGRLRRSDLNTAICGSGDPADPRTVDAVALPCGSTASSEDVQTNSEVLLTR